MNFFNYMCVEFKDFNFLKLFIVMKKEVCKLPVTKIYSP